MQERISNLVLPHHRFMLCFAQICMAILYPTVRRYLTFSYQLSSCHFNVICFSLTDCHPLTKWTPSELEYCLPSLHLPTTNRSQIIYNFHQPLKNLTYLSYTLLTSPQVASIRIYILTSIFFWISKGEHYALGPNFLSHIY